MGFLAKLAAQVTAGLPGRGLPRWRLRAVCHSSDSTVRREEFQGAASDADATRASALQDLRFPYEVVPGKWAQRSRRVVPLCAAR
jgi:hypothetical protein